MTMGSLSQQCGMLLIFISIFLAGFVSFSFASPVIKRFEFNVEWKKVRRLGHTKQLLTVNGQYPGPTIAVHEGDTVRIKVNNCMNENTTIHWHGVKQLRTGWADGPAYITQCPIRAGESYTYKFSVNDQRGTLWWHAHYSWQRASVHGAFIIYPRMPYPFSSSPIEAEIPILFGEWWNGDVEEVENEMLKHGGGPNVSDAYTINGLPGPLYPSSTKDTFISTVERGKTYLLRVINAALNNELFFAIANHTLTVVEVDAAYTKPFNTTAIMIAPGQTTTLLLNTDQVPEHSQMFPMAITPYVTSIFPFNNSTSIGFLRYNSTKIKKFSSKLPENLPEMKDTAFATAFLNKLRSLGSPMYPCNVPKTVHKRVVITISLNLQDCPSGKSCQGLNGKSFFASMNNQSFVRPALSILESHYRNTATKTYSSDFPEKPPKIYDYTGANPLTNNMNAKFGTRVLEVAYGTDLEIVFQGTSFLNVENHPIHVHGHNFFVVGRGFGNFNVARDPAKYNLVDPPERNTVAVSTGGWAAIRIRANNPGAWFIHCHLEGHTSWGLAMGLIVRNGVGESKSLLPPPKDLPLC
ncbi:Laccase-1, partial [Cucurbita argyrosperma subsp. argyrosperma]